MLCIQVERRATKAHLLDGTFRGRFLIPPPLAPPLKPWGRRGPIGSGVNAFALLAEGWVKRAFPHLPPSSIGRGI